MSWCMSGMLHIESITRSHCTTEDISAEHGRGLQLHERPVSPVHCTVSIVVTLHTLSSKSGCLISALLGTAPQQGKGVTACVP